MRGARLRSCTVPMSPRKRSGARIGVEFRDRIALARVFGFEERALRCQAEESAAGFCAPGLERRALGRAEKSLFRGPTDGGVVRRG